MAYRNAETIVRAVRSLVDQMDSHVEIVVVTSGGDDTAARIRDVFGEVTVVESSARLLPGATRNRGVEVTHGPFVAFLGGDCVAEPGWIATRRRLHGDGHLVVASAVTNGSRRSCAAWGFHFGVFAHRLAGRPAGWIGPDSGAAHGCSFARSVLEQIGPFDETLRIGEDTDASRALGPLGVPIWFEPTVRTMHWGPSSFVGLVADRYRRGFRRGRTRGPVSGGWVGVGRLWLGTFRRLPTVWRDADGDRGWLLASLPWWAAGNAASLVGNQRAGGLRTRSGRQSS